MMYMTEFTEVGVKEVGSARLLARGTDREREERVFVLFGYSTQDASFGYHNTIVSCRIQAKLLMMFSEGLPTHPTSGGTSA